MHTISIRVVMAQTRDELIATLMTREKSPEGNVVTLARHKSLMRDLDRQIKVRLSIHTVHYHRVKAHCCHGVVHRANTMNEQEAEGPTASKPRSRTYAELCEGRRALGRKIGLLRLKVKDVGKEIKVSSATSIKIAHEADSRL
jgi:hypothetical protein